MDAKSGTGHAAYGWLRMLRAAGGDATQAKHVYVGEKNAKGQRHGKGKGTFATGDVYVGEWQDGETAISVPLQRVEELIDAQAPRRWSDT